MVAAGWQHMTTLMWASRALNLAAIDTQQQFVDCVCNAIAEDKEEALPDGAAPHIQPCNFEPHDPGRLEATQRAIRDRVLRRACCTDGPTLVWDLH